jgi:hypothetical protein
MRPTSCQGLSQPVCVCTLRKRWEFRPEPHRYSTTSRANPAGAIRRTLEAQRSVASCSMFWFKSWPLQKVNPAGLSNNEEMELYNQTVSFLWRSTKGRFVRARKHGPLGCSLRTLWQLSVRKPLCKIRATTCGPHGYNLEMVVSRFAS